MISDRGPVYGASPSRDALAPRLEHGPGGPARFQLEPDGARAPGRSMAFQVGEDVIEALAADRHASHRETHRGLELQEPAQPAWRQVDLLLAIALPCPAVDLEAGGIDQEPGLAIAPHGLEVLVERPGVIDVGRAQGDVALAIEGRPGRR